MITDKLGTYCEEQDFFDNEVSTNVIDHVSDESKVGGGAANKYLHIIVTTDFDDTNIDTETFELKISDNENMSTATIIFSTGAIDAGVLTKGAHLTFPIPANLTGQYSRLDSTEVQADSTPGDAGAISAYLTY